MDRSCAPAAGRRFLLPVVGLGVLTIVAIFACSWAVREAGLGDSTRLAVAMVPAVLWGSFVVLEVLYVRALDELQRRIVLESLAIAYPTAMMLGLLVEYLQKAGFATGLTVGDVWPFMAILFVPAYAFARWRYR